jgi:CRISPR-associated protein Cas2
MIYLIVYDVDDDKKRSRLSSLLEELGTRVQESVFECSLDSSLYNDLLKRIVPLAGDGVNIRIYPLCKECYLKAVGFGEIKKIPGLRGYEII